MARRLLPPLYTAWQIVTPLIGRRAIPLPRSDGTIERDGIEVMHFPAQTAFLTDVPSMYHPWDLQHIHHPELFTPRNRFRRDLSYSALCAQASVVAVAVTSAKEDLTRHFRLAPEKIDVIAIAPATECYEPPRRKGLARLRHSRRLPERFAFYLAHTWPHKNHLALVEALRLLRSRGLNIPLVCSGGLTDFYPRIARAVRAAGLVDSIRFLGYVSSTTSAGSTSSRIASSSRRGLRAGECRSRKHS
jgi:glycosyltransferase involved in cell wall biosynthesis